MPGIDGFDLARITKGAIVSGDGAVSIKSISTDTRTISGGELFIPLVGENYDGHDYIHEALAKGATGCLTDRDIDGTMTGKLMVKVDDTLGGLQAIAAFVRMPLKAKVLAITGSTGKTTTRAICEKIIRSRFNTVSSRASFNNEVGVPLTLLKANDETEVIILEMAMRGLGQIARLCEIAKPDIGCITNVGKTHYELLGSEENIGKAKGELVESIPGNGIVVLNIDDVFTDRYRDLTPARVITYGLDARADIRAENITMADRCPVFDLLIDGQSYYVRLGLMGRHNVYNAMAAAGMALAAGVDAVDIVKGLAGAENESMRMQVEMTADGVTVINDTYNANPDSMRAALTILADYESGSKIAVLGDMLELGDISIAEHRSLGRFTAKAGIDMLVTVGNLAREISHAAIEAGLKHDSVHHCVDHDTAVRFVKNRLKPGDVVLAKASRALMFEKIIDGIMS